MTGISQGIAVIDNSGRFEFVSRNFAQLLNQEAAALPGKRLTDFILDYDANGAAAAPNNVPPTESTSAIWLSRQGQAPLPATLTTVPRFQEQTVVGATVIITTWAAPPITDEMLDVVISAAPNAMLLIDDQGQIQFANRHAETLFGYAPGALNKQPLSIMLPEHLREKHEQIMASYFLEPTSRPMGNGRHLPGLHRDGYEFPIEIALGPVKQADSWLILASLVDLTEQKEAEALIRQQQEDLRIIFEQTPSGILTINMQGEVTDANPYSLKLLGSPSREATIGLNVLTVPPLVKAGISALFERVLRKGETEEMETWYTSLWGKSSYLFIRAVPHFDGGGQQIGLILLVEDLTQRIQAEEGMRQMQKLESLGVLAGGIAHDFNNLLAAMLAQTSLALAKLPEYDPARVHIEKAITATERASQLTQQLLAYSGRGHFQVVPLNLNDFLEENLHLFSATIPKHIMLQVSYSDQPPVVEADVAQMQQVVMNLIINAAEAIGAKSGVISATTEWLAAMPEPKSSSHHVSQPTGPGPFVSLTIADDGPGIPARAMERIFDPFYTTKPKGHGLGLSAVLGIVRGHRGGLFVESDPEQGTRFQLVLPAGQLPPQADSPPAATVVTEKKSGLVLVIDDEEAVCDAVTDILHLDGLDVLTAPNGEAGLALYQAREADIGLILLDLSMPGWTGVRTLQALRQINPNVRVILSSGYHETEAVRRFADQGLTDFLQKPYSADQLLTTVRRHHQ